jgi:hypothetical protein
MYDHRCYNRCDENLEVEVEGSTRLVHWVERGTGTPTDRDEVNRREVCGVVPSFVATKLLPISGKARAKENNNKMSVFIMKR